MKNTLKARQDQFLLRRIAIGVISLTLATVALMLALNIGTSDASPTPKPQPVGVASARLGHDTELETCLALYSATESDMATNGAITNMLIEQGYPEDTLYTPFEQGGQCEGAY